MLGHFSRRISQKRLPASGMHGPVGVGKGWPMFARHNSRSQFDSIVALACRRWSHHRHATRGADMVIIKTTCPSCGEVDLTADKVELRVAIGGEGSSYAFDCPRCTDRIRKPADA